MKKSQIVTFIIVAQIMGIVVGFMAALLITSTTSVGSSSLTEECEYSLDAYQDMVDVAIDGFSAVSELDYDLSYQVKDDLDDLQDDWDDKYGVETTEELREICEDSAN